jgi:hypothetical protein
VGEDRSGTSRRVTVAEAAEVLGVTVEAVRGRIKRGTLDAERTPEGVFVRLVADQPTDRVRPADDQSTDQSPYRTVGAAEFIEEMRDRIQDLREQLASERRANEENRRIIAALTQRIPEIEAPREQEATTSAPGAPEAATEQPGRVGPQTEVEGPREATEQPQRRSWWREFFGFD